MASLLTEDPIVARRTVKRLRRAWHVFAAAEFAAWRHRERVADGPGGFVRVSDAKCVHGALFGRTMWTRSRTLADAYLASMTDADAPTTCSWRDVPPGSAWLDDDGDLGLRWPTVRGGLDCGWNMRSFQLDDDADVRGSRQVQIVAVGLTDADCDRIAATTQDKRIELARRLATKRGCTVKRPCKLFARAPGDGGVRWTRDQLDWVAASSDDDERTCRVQVLAAIVGVVIDQTWGVAVVDSDDPNATECILAVAWSQEPYASLKPDELELLCARWLHEEDWRPEHGGDAALAAMRRAEEKWARASGCDGGDPHCFYASREEHDGICSACTASIDRKMNK